MNNLIEEIRKEKTKIEVSPNGQKCPFKNRSQMDITWYNINRANNNNNNFINFSRNNGRSFNWR